MEFPKLQMQTQKKLDELEQSPDRIRKDIEEALRILDGHDNAARKKQEAYERYQLMIDTDPEAAKVYWDKKKLAVTWKHVAEKFQSLMDSCKELKGIPDLRKELEKEMDTVLQFSPMQEQADNPVVEKEFYFAKDGWGETRNSEFKTFQDWLTPPKYRMLPERDGCFGNEPYDGIPLQYCIVNPELIPDRLIKEFGLAELPDDLDPLQRLKLKAKLIPKVRSFFEHLDPLLKFSRKGKASNYRFLVLRNYADEHNGKVIYFHYLSTLPRAIDRKIMQTFDSVYSAHRKTEHEDRGYEAEIQKVLALEARLKAIHRQLAGIRARDPDADEEKEEIRKQLEEKRKEFRYFISYYKRSARLILYRIAGLKDKLGRENLAASCASLLKALDHIKKRPQEIFTKSKSTAEDRKTLELQIAQGQVALGECFTEFKNLCQALVKPRGRQEGLPGYQRKAVFRHLGNLPDLSELHARPFNLYAHKLHERRNAIAKALRASDYKKIRDESIKAFVICKIFEVQKVLEEVLRDISLLPLETHIGVLLEKAKKLSEVVRAREVFSNIEVESYKKVYEELEKKIRDLVRGLKYYENNNLSPEDRQAMYQRLKKYLEDIDFPEILAKLD